MIELLEAMRFAWKCFLIFRDHQKCSAGGFSTYRCTYAEVPNIVMILGTGREAWRVSDFATNYFADRGGK